MKKASVSESAFCNPRVLIGFGFSTIALLLALVAFLTFPSSSALAQLPRCSPVGFDESGHYPNTVFVSMSSNAGATIYYTVGTVNYPPAPTHSSAIYSAPLGTPGGQKRFYKAIANKPGVCTDSVVTQYEVDNTGL